MLISTGASHSPQNWSKHVKKSPHHHFSPAVLTTYETPACHILISISAASSESPCWIRAHTKAGRLINTNCSMLPSETWKKWGGGKKKKRFEICLTYKKQENDEHPCMIWHARQNVWIKLTMRPSWQIHWLACPPFGCFWQLGAFFLKGVLCKMYGPVPPIKMAFSPLWANSSPNTPPPASFLPVLLFIYKNPLLCRAAG